MRVVTLDLETHYGPGYTLSSMTTEAYVRDPRFEAILCSFAVDDEPPYWVPRDGIAAELRRLRLHECAVLMHHAHFDGLILSHHYGIRPRLFLDTLGMARALHGANGGLSLAKLAQRYGIGRKGDEVLNVRGMRYADFTPAALQRYGDYGCLDVDLTRRLGQLLAPQFSHAELQTNDMVVRMFTEPVLELDAQMLQRYAERLRAEKIALLLQAGVQQEDLMSNAKFALVLQELGIDPPLKISPATGKETWAFAKTDPGMQALQEHPDERVQILVEARLKNKTTIAEKGAERLVAMAGRGPATVYLKYSGASGSHRFSGGDGFNWQSMKRGSDLRNAVMAPPGHLCVVGDSSNIEARILDWLAGQDDMVQVYREYDAGRGSDVYCVLAERIYKRPISKDRNPHERQMGKVAKLGLGYGMGHIKFVTAVRGQAKDEDGKPLVITESFSRNVVDIYRNAHAQVLKLWKRGEEALKAIARGEIGTGVDYRGIVKTCPEGLIMPGGLRILYPELRYEKNSGPFGGEWSFWNGKMREHIYGAKVVENCVQCLARLIVIEQCRWTAKDLKDLAHWVHSVHDEGVFVAPAFEAPYTLATLMKNMRTPLSWCETLPLNSEGGIHRRYGQAKT